MRQIEVPGWVRAMTRLEPIDYEDGFRLESCDSPVRSGVDWARAVLEQAPERWRRQLRGAWSALGFGLARPGRTDAVLGWSLRREDTGLAVLATSSPLGIRGELVFVSRPDGLLYGTFVSLAGDDARRAWARVESAHQPAVRGLLESAADRV